MNNQKRMIIKIIIILVLVVAVGFAVYLKEKRGTTDQGQETLSTAGSSGIPRLVDLGAGQCIPCKMMAPILSELTTEYAGRLEVAVIDVRENPAAAEPYSINLIPTQIFYDTAGKELYRHEGFFSKEDILAKWKELGIDIETQPKKDMKGIENETQN
jgi:thioredoxin 1